jgi:hypothetical protein
MHQLFATHVYTSVLQRSGSRELNRQLLKEGRQLKDDDAAGRRWSAKNYRGGYTSYGSSHKLHRISPTFQDLERRLKRHVKAFAAAVEWDLTGRELAMTDCWLNIMLLRACSLRISRHQIRGSASRPLHGCASSIGAGRPSEPAVGHPPRRGRTGRPIRELAAPRGGPPFNGGRTRQRELQLQLVLGACLRSSQGEFRAGPRHTARIAG